MFQRIKHKVGDSVICAAQDAVEAALGRVYAPYSTSRVRLAYFGEMCAVVETRTLEPVHRGARELEIAWMLQRRVEAINDLDGPRSTSFSSFVVDINQSADPMLGLSVL